MQAPRLPARRGIYWLLAGFNLFWRNPVQLTALTVSYLLIVQLSVQLLPALAPFLLPLVLPTLTLIVANGSRIVDQGRPTPLAGVLYGVRENGAQLIQLGGLQLLGAFVLVAVTMLFDANLNIVDLEKGQDHTEALFALGRLLLLATPLLMAFWFAPFLTGWDRVPAAKSVFFSFVASWRNWPAMTVYGLAVGLVAAVIPGLLLVVASLISPALVNILLVALRTLLVFVLAPVLTCSLYQSYRDIFHPPAAEPAPTDPLPAEPPQAEPPHE